MVEVYRVEDVLMTQEYCCLEVKVVTGKCREYEAAMARHLALVCTALYLGVRNSAGSN